MHFLVHIFGLVLKLRKSSQVNLQVGSFLKVKEEEIIRLCTLLNKIVGEWFPFSLTKHFGQWSDCK